MTVFLRDMSHYDDNESLAGFVGATHKVTEGTDAALNDAKFAARINAWHNAGVQVLGAYHVVRTGSLDAQVAHWFARLDAVCGWWRTTPFILQIDLEHWPYDQVSAATGKAFAAKVVAAAPDTAWVVTYASRGQYGDSLAGIATDLWNAHYVSGTYPGDTSSDWAPYSGKTPALLQYTSTPFDKNAYRGTLEQLLAHMGGDTVALSADEARKLSNTEYLTTCLALGLDPDPKRIDWGRGPGVGVPDAPNPFAALATGVTQDQVDAAVDKAVSAKMDDLVWLGKLAAAIAAHVHVS